MTIAWIAVLFAVAYFIFGLVARSPFQRRFEIGVAADQEIDGYLVPQEYIDDDEDDIAQRVSSAFSADTRRRKRHAGINDATFHEPHWGHTTGLLRGELVIDDVKALPEKFRVGLFAKNATYSVVARPNFTKDPDLKFAINRLSVKLEYPDPVPNVYSSTGEAHELDLLFAEGVLDPNGSGRQFFARDARQLDMATTLKPPSLNTLKTLTNWRNIRMFLQVLNSVDRMMKPIRSKPSNVTGWAGKPYFSAGPYALGKGAMKFCLQPNQAHPMPAVDLKKSDPTAAHKAAMDAWFERGQDASFDLCIQLATSECIREPEQNDPPKSVMAAEYCDLEWDERRSPYINVGVLTLRADTDLNEAYSWSPLQFNAWNTLPVMRPIGQLFRVRKLVHKSHSNSRLEHLYDAEPGTMVGKCPFA